METKSHLKETSLILMRIVEDLKDIVKDLNGNFKPKEESGNCLSSRCKIDLSNFECNERMIIESFLKATDEFFENLHKLKSGVSKTVSVTCSVSGTNNVEPLTDNEIFLLMKNFEKLDDEKKSWFLKLLSCIEETDPVRYKSLKSPF